MMENIFPQVDKYVAARNNMVKTQITDRGITECCNNKSNAEGSPSSFRPKGI